VTLRIGVLGAARIAPQAIVKPARRVDGVEVRAVAARDRAKAETFATKHGIPVVHGSYDDLLADADIDAVYNPLPNGLHGHWTIKALDAGKHVLCEKPFTADAAEARLVAAAAARHPDRTVMEAFHYRYHPLTDRLLEIIASGEIGAVRRIETRMVIPLLRRGDIRWQLSLAGGSLMDVGCYTIHLLRTLAGAEPTVVSASASELTPGVDRYASAEMRFDDGRTGHITAAMLAPPLLRLDARVDGSDGVLRVRNPYAPQFMARLSVRGPNGSRRETASRDPSYLFQLRAFQHAVDTGVAPITDVHDAVANMDVIDAVYRAAGLSPRTPTPVP
jgi:predicted dehydrogenase